MGTTQQNGSNSLMFKDEVVVPFTEDFKRPARNGTIVFCAASFNAWVESVLPIVQEIKPTALKVFTHARDVGKYKFYVARFPKLEKYYPYPFSTKPSTRRARLTLNGNPTTHCAFDGEINIPILSTERGEPWMSLTPNEVLTQAKLVKVAKGDVGIAGMGLGWLAQRVLMQPRVTSVTVYDIELDVLKFFRDQVDAVAKQVGKRVRFVHANAYEVDWMKHDQSLWDIWMDVNGGSDDYRFWKICNELRQAGKSCHGWYTVKPTQWCVNMMKRREKELQDAAGV